MPRTTFKHKLESGEIVTRQSATRVYTHVVVVECFEIVSYDLHPRTARMQNIVTRATGGQYVAQWCMSEENARKACGGKLIARHGARVEAINGGTR